MIISGPDTTNSSTLCPRIRTHTCGLSRCRAPGQVPVAGDTGAGWLLPSAGSGRARTLSRDNLPPSQAEELRTQLRLLEDARDGLRRELLEAQRKVRDSQDGREAQRQEASELRRSLGEGVKEREALRRSNEELRAAVKKAESERIRWGNVGAGASSVLHRAHPSPWITSLEANFTPRALGKSHRWGVCALEPRLATWVVLGNFPI